MIKLKSLQIFPKSISGLASDKLYFGENITQLFGPNGCGKTPLLQSIAYCLGYPSIFRNEIYERCERAELELETNNTSFKIARNYVRDDLEIEITNLSIGDKQSFYNESEFSNFMFENMGIETEKLVSNSNKPTSVYLASLIPIFYIEQDHGYSNVYCPPSNFIRDQFSEMMRLTFNLPAKNVFDKKKARIEAKKELDFLDERVEEYESKLQIATKNLTSHNVESLEKINEQLESNYKQLDILKNNGADSSDYSRVFDNLINDCKSSIFECDKKLDEISNRNKGINQIIKEINTEIETLTLNEEARRVFLSFNEICSNSSCELFSFSSDSYSKNLLYLKDQIKDLERNMGNDEVRHKEISDQKNIFQKQLQGLYQERNKIPERKEVSLMIDTISELYSRIHELEEMRNEHLSIQNLEKIIAKYSGNRRKAFDIYQSVNVSNSKIPDLYLIIKKMRKAIVKWIDTLKTENLSREISFKDEFKPLFGGEALTQISGSTRIRAVLAYHAALLETLVTHDSCGMGFLILDTPKQHEIDNAHLNAYFESLKELIKEKNIQVIFSTTEYHYNGDSEDTEWTPLYPGDEHNMFLKSTSLT